MAFYEEISQLTTLDTTHCDNFNNINQKLLENTLYCYTNIGNLYNLQTSNKNSLVDAINEIKTGSSSSTDINSGVDAKISVHNQSSDSHPLFQQKINNLMSYVGIPYAKKMNYPNYNNITETGVYYTTDGTNSPGSGSWYLEVLNANGNIIYQRAKCVSGGLLERFSDRVYDTSTQTWTSWKQIADVKKIDDLNIKIRDNSNEINRMKPTVQDNSEKINVLSEKRKMITYTNLINIGCSESSTFPEIAKSMENNSRLIFSSYATLSWFPQGITNDRNDIEITRYSGGVNYTKVKIHTNKAGIWYGHYDEQSGLIWKQIAITDKTEISFPYESGFVDNTSADISNITKVNNLVMLRINLKKTDSSYISTGSIIGNLPSGYRPSSHIRASVCDLKGNSFLCEVLVSGVVRIKHTLDNNITTIGGEVVYYV